MRILRASDYRTMPWKNGVGTTTEIAVHPEGAGLDTFDWRVSMARVEMAGPFSAFQSIDRTLAVLDGQGIVLEVKGEKPVTLTATTDPLSFPADVQTSASLVGGPITDLNVMTRRGSWRHTVERIAARHVVRLDGPDAATLLLVHQGTVNVRVAGQQAMLSARDCMWVEAGEEVAAEPRDAAELFVIRLIRLG